MRRRLLYHKANGDDPIIKTEYSIPEIKLVYNTAEATATELDYSTFTHVQVRTDTYASGKTEETEITSLGSSDSVVFSLSGGSTNTKIDSSTGKLTFDANETENQITLGTVTVTVIMNGQTGTGECVVYQKAGNASEYTSFPMDILMLNNETHKQEIMGSEEHTTKDFPKETYTPIGIVLTPVYRGSTYDHDGWSYDNNIYSGYGNDIGVMGVIALTDASLDSPETGTTEPSEIYCGNWSSYQGKLWIEGGSSNPYNYYDPEGVPYIDNDGTPTEDIVGWIYGSDCDPAYTKNIVSAATDKSDTIASPVDIWSGYAQASGHKAPSPYWVSEIYRKACQEYGETGDFEGYNNKAFAEYDEVPINTRSALADYAGELNSLAILLGISDARTRSWIENPITNSNANTTDCPAVIACWKYAPEGTAQGGWYLPALGELSLMAARFNKINETLSLLATYYGVKVSLLRDTEVPYLSSTHFFADLFDESANDYIASQELFALFPNINEDMIYNCVYTSNIVGVDRRYKGYVRPFKKIKNEIPNASINIYYFTPHYELMPAHYTDTFCNGNSKREWFGQKFIVSFRRGCLDVGKDQLGNYNYNINSDYLRLYGYRIKGENDTTKVDETPRVLAEVWVEGLSSASSATWPTYSGDEKGVNIVGRFTTTPVFDTDGAFDRDTDAYLDMDTDEFDRDGTVEPGWYIIAGVAIYGKAYQDLYGSNDWHILENTTRYNVAVVKDEIDIVNGVESKEAFFDEIRTTPYNNYRINTVTEYPFYVGQLDRPVAFLFASYSTSNDD